MIIHPHISLLNQKSPKPFAFTAQPKEMGEFRWFRVSGAGLSSRVTVFSVLCVWVDACAVQVRVVLMCISMWPSDECPSMLSCTRSRILMLYLHVVMDLNRTKRDVRTKGRTLFIYIFFTLEPWFLFSELCSVCVREFN